MTGMNCILTGAGFSANVGTPVASALNEQIFTLLHARGHADAAHLVREHGYEKAFDKLEPSDDAFDRIKRATMDAFMAIDVLHRSIMPTQVERQKHYASLWHMINILALAGNDGYIFTINYDMVVERFWSVGNNSKVAIVRPYLEENDWFMQESLGLGLESANLTVNLDVPVPSGCKYLKLHGSIDRWRSGVYPVIGATKQEDLNRDPLLRQYWTEFESALNRGDVRLLVIGYGFGDEHINDKLVNATNHGIRIFNWNTQLYNAKECPCTELEGPAKIESAIVGSCRQTICERYPLAGKGWPEGSPDLIEFFRRT